MGKKKSIGLPGGPNEFLQDITQYISVEGYKRYSDDLNNPFNIIDSGNITMEDVDFPVIGIDNLGNSQMMQPGMNYQFPGDQVFEVPKAQYGDETVQEEFEIDDRTGKINTRKGYDEGKLFEFAKDKYEKIDTQKQKDDLLYKLSTPAFRERYKKNIFNISGENLSDEELTSRINSQIDFTAAGPDFAVKMPFVTHSSNKGYKRGITPFIYPFSSSQELDYRNARGLYQKNFNIDYPDGSTPDFPEFDQYSYLIQLADKRDPYIMGDRDVVPFDKEKGTIVHEYAHSYNTENSPLFEPEGEDFTVVDKGNTWERIPGKRYKNWLSNLFGEDYFTQEGQKYGSWAMKPWEISSVRSENEQSLKNANIWDNTKGEFGEGNLNKMLSSRRFNPESAARMHLDKLGYSELERIQYGIKRLKIEQGDLNDEIAEARPGSRNNDFIINNIINSEYEPSMDMDTFNTIFNSSQNDLKDKQKYSDYNSLLEDYNGKNKRKKKIATKVLDVIYSGVKNKLNEGYTEKKINLQNTFDEKKKEVLPKMKMYFNEIAVNNSDQPEMAQYGGALPKAQKGATISQYKEPAWYEKAGDYLASPMTSLGYLVRGQGLPDRIPINAENRNVFDMAYDVINPVAWAAYAESADKNLEEGNYLAAGFDAMAAIPVIPSFVSRGSKVVKATKGAPQLYKRPYRALDQMLDMEGASSFVTEKPMTFTHISSNPALGLDNIKTTEAIPVGKRPKAGKRIIRDVEAGVSDPRNAPAGFYTISPEVGVRSTFAGSGSPGSHRYNFEMPAGSRVLDFPGGTSVMSAGNLQEALDMGYDVIRGNDMGVGVEFLPLNKSKMSEFRGELIKKYGGLLPTAQKGREQATISAYEEPAWYEKAADYLANPFTSFGYSVRGEDIPDGLDVNNPNRNNFDMVVDILNPFAWYQYGENAAQDFKEEEYLNATFNTLGALPFIPASLVAAKNLKTPLQKIAANTSRSMSNANANVKGRIPSVRPNWSKWNKEIPNNKSLMEEYNAIEKIGKADGTWMKNPDGSMFKGTPEQWVQIRSSNYKKAFPNALLDDSGSPLINYHGSGSKFDIFDESKFYSGEYGKGVYTSTDKEAILKSYANPNKNRTKKIAGKSGTDKPTANLYELYINAKNPLTTDDILDYRNFGKIMDNLPSLADWKASDLGKRLIKQNQWLKTDDDIISFIKMNFPRNPVKESFIDQGGDFLRAIDSPLQEGVTPFNNQMKSSIGNNGMFDMTDPNIYKQKGGESLEEYQDKGEVEKNLDAINKQLAKKTYNPYRDIDEESQTRRTELTDAINFIVNDQGGDENLRDLLIMTAFMENSYGANADAYGRDYTRGPMSIDDIAYKHMFEMRKGANDYTASQKKYIDWFDSMGYDLEHMDEHLRNDIKANVAASRYQYGTNKNPLPSSKDPKALYNYYMDTYNRTDKNHYDRFLKGYNEFIGKKEFGGSINKYLTYKKFMNGGYTGNDKIEAEKIYDKLNRIHYRDAKQRGLSPQNYIMTNLLGNS